MPEPDKRVSSLCRKRSERDPARLSKFKTLYKCEGQVSHTSIGSPEKPWECKPDREVFQCADSASAAWHNGC